MRARTAKKICENDWGKLWTLELLPRILQPRTYHFGEHFWTVDNTLQGDCSGWTVLSSAIRRGFYTPKPRGVREVTESSPRPCPVHWSTIRWPLFTTTTTSICVRRTWATAIRSGNGHRIASSTSKLAWSTAPGPCGVYCSLVGWTIPRLRNLCEIEATSLIYLVLNFKNKKKLRTTDKGQQIKSFMNEEIKLLFEIKL